MRKLTMQAIAEAAGVSCATVSRCLSGREGVGGQTRERVLRLCRDMGYHPNFAEEAPRRSGRMGLVTTSLRVPGAAAMTAALEACLSHMGYALVVCQSAGEDMEEVLSRLEAQRVEGVIFLLEGKEGKKVSESSLPSVFLNAHLGNRQENYVAVDHFLGGQAAVRHLHSLGHRRIGFVSGGDPEVCRQRRRGYESACRQLKLELLPWEECTAVVAGDWTAALTLPGDRAVISFDGEAPASAGLGLSTYDSPDSMARIAVDILLEQLERPIGGYSHRMVLPELVRRGSDFAYKEENHG